jgi:hypothetical protein
MTIRVNPRIHGEQVDRQNARNSAPTFGGLLHTQDSAAEADVAALQGGVGLGEGWANLPGGSFATEDSADLIDYVVQKNAVSSAVVEFSLVIGHTSSGWAKAIIMPDGLGSSWEIRAQGRGASATNGLWADQVHNGQILTFRKPKGFGVWHDVIEIGFLGDLDPGDRAVFIWRRD